MLPRQPLRYLLADDPGAGTIIMAGLSSCFLASRWSSRVVESGMVASSAGSLRLLRWAELAEDWAPEQDAKSKGGTPVWESLHQLIRALNRGGESAAGGLLARIPECAEPMRALAYRLYTLCARKSWAEDARAYNELVPAWQSIEQAAGAAGIAGSQVSLDM